MDLREMDSKEIQARFGSMIAELDGMTSTHGILALIMLLGEMCYKRSEEARAAHVPEETWGFWRACGLILQGVANIIGADWARIERNQNAKH